MYKVSYTGDGATTEFLFAFPFFQDADVRVAIAGTVLDGTQYGVVANEEFNGGIVVFATPPSDGAQIDIFRQVQLSRIVDYQPTAKINPEDLNTDFNLLIEAFRDVRAIEVDLTEWANTHDNVMNFLRYTTQLIEDKLAGGAVLGLFSNLLSVLDGALPKLINDYGSITEPADVEYGDDYGLL
ncbi:MAG: hypothetical protein K2L94_00290 [Alphaproteobacteria bacterium]|nr:hypothetical protein [Alphaproteobacteria bacterium]